MATSYPNPRPSVPGTVRITDPGDLIASVPALLGFRPGRSLVLICLGFAADAVPGAAPCTVRAVLRSDLPETACGPFDLEPLRRVAQACERERIESVTAVFVDPDDSACARLMHENLLDELRECLDGYGVELEDVYELAALTAGETWRGLRGAGSRGVLPDPGATQVAAARVLAGRVMHGSREELEAHVRPAGGTDRGAMTELLTQARARAAGGSAGRDAGARDRELVERVLVAVARNDSGDEHTADELVEIALALAVPRVRDCLLGLTLTDEADAAERMWLLLARTLPPPDCAQAATMYGFSVYCRGEGPMAGIALVAALEADPRHRLAGLLDRALQRAVHPDVVADLAATGLELAAGIGVAMPPVSGSCAR
ncbi:DUF4192 domain-containing protein [Rhodococcus kronopolitis]|uniref:DUF4192 domain-containing protein n=1 Tax=Rhodococcus kronopolitis TaxID=1460226 RepID=A0ABV9FLC6_9NOCA